MLNNQTIVRPKAPYIMSLFSISSKSPFIALILVLLIVGCGDAQKSEKNLDKKPQAIPVVKEAPEIKKLSNENDVESKTVTIEKPVNTLDPIISAEPVEDLETKPVSTSDPLQGLDFDTETSEDIPVEEAAKADVSNESEDFKVVLTADENLKLQEKGELTVWIGFEENKVEVTAGKAQDETSIPASIGQYAKITPFAPNFEVSPVEYSCIRIHPSGSEVRFVLTPTTAGDYEVSANIEIFDNSECSGTPIPKSAAKLTVLVEVDRKQNIINKGNEMGEVLWDKFMIFWGALLALGFGFILYLIRRKMKKKTGFDGE